MSTARSRREGEVVRIKHSIDLLQAHLKSLREVIDMPVPLGAEAAQSILTVTSLLAMQIAKHDAYMLIEKDEKPDAE